ncbi:MAG: ImmA/IrrE family metallo-endopeptidase [Candidatus Binataceae bacterium]
MRWMTHKPAARARFNVVMIAAAILLLPSRVGARDDWTAASHVTLTAPGNARAASGAPAAHGTLIACGQRVAPAAPAIGKIVSRIDAVWDVDTPVYQSAVATGPHVVPGGCIFYNKKTLTMLMRRRLGVRNTNDRETLLYAIFAHEAGHDVHRDFSPTRANVPNRIKELEADRFAGYTLEELNLDVTNIAPYWSMAGDEFSTGPGHGTSAQRVAAFKEGWHLAEWGRPENDESVSHALDDPVAPDNPSTAPQ